MTLIGRGQAEGQVKCGLAQVRPRSYDQVDEALSLSLSLSPSLKCALALMCRQVIEAERKVGDQERLRDQEMRTYHRDER